MRIQMQHAHRPAAPHTHRPAAPSHEPGAHSPCLSCFPLLRVLHGGRGGRPRTYVQFDHPHVRLADALVLCAPLQRHCPEGGEHAWGHEVIKEVLGAARQALEVALQQPLIKSSLALPRGDKPHKRVWIHVRTHDRVRGAFRAQVAPSCVLLYCSTEGADVTCIKCVLLQLGESNIQGRACCRPCCLRCRSRSLLHCCLHGQLPISSACAVSCTAADWDV
mmetsp:Transcript_10262/g.21996  ORF Transcript_10262/g.21996 Transcript_10262/m.21996 type:complete len:220 (+) Transcript_10262:435-1094(+)